MKQVIIFLISVILIASLTPMTFAVEFKQIEGLRTVDSNQIDVETYVVYPLDVDNSFWFGGDASNTAKLIIEEALTNFGVPEMVSKEGRTHQYLQMENPGSQRNSADFMITGNIILLKDEIVNEKGVGVLIPGENPWLNEGIDILIDKQFDKNNKNKNWDQRWKSWEDQQRLNNMRHTKRIIEVKVTLVVVDVNGQRNEKFFTGKGSSKSKTYYDYGVTSGYDNAISAQANIAVANAVEDAVMQLLNIKDKSPTKSTKEKKNKKNGNVKKVAGFLGNLALRSLGKKNINH